MQAQKEGSLNASQLLLASKEKTASNRCVNEPYLIECKFALDATLNAAKEYFSDSEPRAESDQHHG